MEFVNIFFQKIISRETHKSPRNEKWLAYRDLLQNGFGDLMRFLGGLYTVILPILDSNRTRIVSDRSVL